MTELYLYDRGYVRLKINLRGILDRKLVLKGDVLYYVTELSPDIIENQGDQKSFFGIQLVQKYRGDFTQKDHILSNKT